VIEFHIGIDGGGTGTRVRLARPDGSELAQAQGPASALSHGSDAAWQAIDSTLRTAFANAGLPFPGPERLALGLGLAGVHNPAWAEQFRQQAPQVATLVLDNDAVTTLLGAHMGQPGLVVALGTGSVAMALHADGSTAEAGGWGFPAGDEASGAWLGLRAVGHMQHTLDGRTAACPLSRSLCRACGGERAAIQDWLGKARQPDYAALAPLILGHAGDDPQAYALLAEAGREVVRMVCALDPQGALPLAMCGGLGDPLRAFLPRDLQERCVPPQGDAAAGALLLLRRHLDATSGGARA
jgi:glucosamine kinase